MTKTAKFSSAAQLAEMWAQVYRLLTLGFLFPTPEMTDRILNGAFRADLSSSLNGVCGEKNLFAAPLENLRQFEDKHMHEAVRAALDELNIEYVRLFLSPETPIVPPYESAYNERAEEKEKYLLMVGSTARQIENIYRLAGVSVARELNESPDHMATELEFMFYLYENEAAAWREGDSKKATEWHLHALAFMDEHLGKWGLTFCRKVKKEGNSLFYVSLALILSTIIELARRRVADTGN